MDKQPLLIAKVAALGVSCCILWEFYRSHKPAGWEGK